MTIEEKAIVVTETNYVISFRRYECNCDREEYKYHYFNEAVVKLMEYHNLVVYDLKFEKVTTDKLDIKYLL